MYPLEKVKLFNRVLHLVRSQAGHAGAVTRKKNKERARTALEREKQNTLF